MNVSYHARKRYCERVLDISLDKIGAHLEEHGAQVDQAVLGMVNDPDMIIKNEDKDYYLKDVLLLVVADQTVVTIIKSDYGFDESMNRQIVQHLKETFQTLQRELHEKEEVAIGRQAVIKAEVEALDQDIKLVESNLREKKALRRQLEAQSAGIEAELGTAISRIETVGSKLIYSTAYKTELLVMRNEKKRA